MKGCSRLLQKGKPMNERDELLGAARRNLEDVMTRAQLLRSDVARCLSAVEAIGADNRFLASAMEDAVCMVRCLRWAHDDLRTEAEVEAETGGQP